MAMTYETWARRLREVIKLPSPRAGVSPDYAPQLAYGRHEGPPAVDYRHGAVLILFYPVHDVWHIMLTERASHLSSHAGQISFPGGRVEAGESPTEAALREFGEEVGTLGEFEVIGELPETYVYASRFLISPVVAITSARPQLHISEAEVASILELPWHLLDEEGRRGSHLIQRGPVEFVAPHFQFGPHRIWGATWIILGELWERQQ